MWVTQTYLRSPDPSSSIHVYYLFEAYNELQMGLTSAIQQELSSLGRQYGRTVTLYMPDPHSVDHIGGELRALEPLWHEVYGKLPGLLVLTRPLEEYDRSNPESFYIPLVSDGDSISGPPEIAKAIHRLTEITEQQLRWEFDNRTQAPAQQGALSKLFDAIEMKPGFAGFKVDLKQLLMRNR
jgi:hypothetical protein